MKETTIYEKKYSSPFFFTHSKEFGGSKEDYHFHDLYEIYLFLSADGQAEISNNNYNMEYGDIFIINNRDIHRFNIPHEILYDRYTVMFCPSYVNGISTRAADILKSFKYQNNNFKHKVSLKDYSKLFSLEEILDNLEEISHSLSLKSDFERELSTKISFSKLLLKLNLIYEKQLHTDTTAINQGDPEKFETILTYIDKNLANDLSLERLSKEFYMNKYYLSHYFKNKLNLPIGKYITQKRIESAKKLLLKGLNIYEVMDEVGFNNYNHFLKTFKKSTGMTTREFLKIEKS